MAAREITVILDGDNSLRVTRQQITGGGWEVSAVNTSREGIGQTTIYNTSKEAVDAMADLICSYVKSKE